MAVGDYFQLDLLYEIPGKQGACTFHFLQLTAGPGAASEDSKYCFDTVANSLALSYSSVLPSQLSFLGAYVRQATTGVVSAYPYLGLFPSKYTGGLTGEILPEGTGPLALIGPATITTNPRREVNRKYLPAMRELDQVDGAIAQSLVTLVTDEMNFWTAPTYWANDFQWITYSRTSDQQAQNPAWPVETVRVSDQIARLVKRRPKYQGRS
jgi:hypothetical protein